jgi:recombination protein RecR
LNYPRPIQNLINSLSRLPALGKRSAERIALHLLKSDPELSRQLAQAILDAKTKMRRCGQCGNYTELDPCAICTGENRDTGLLCVVEGPNDILTLEKAGAFKGRYHALMGRISPLNGVGPEQLRVASLLDRVQAEPPREIVIALGADVESEATASYLAEQLKPTGITVTRIALGLPAGSALESADDITLTRALEGRHRM